MTDLRLVWPFGPQTPSYSLDTWGMQQSAPDSRDVIILAGILLVYCLFMSPTCGVLVKHPPFFLYHFLRKKNPSITSVTAVYSQNK